MARFALVKLVKQVLLWCESGTFFEVKAMIQKSAGNVRWLLLINTLLDSFAFWL